MNYYLEDEKVLIKSQYKQLVRKYYLPAKTPYIPYDDPTRTITLNYLIIDRAGSSYKAINFDAKIKILDNEPNFDEVDFEFEHTHSYFVRDIDECFCLELDFIGKVVTAIERRTKKDKRHIKMYRNLVTNLGLEILGLHG